ncbi:MAG: DNA polymerase IV [Chitinophagales bacterium]
MYKTVVHLDLDTFFVSCERLKNSALEGVPLLIGGKSDRGVVASCSYEARYYGIHSAMPMRMAMELCPHATVIRGDMDLYSYYSKMVTEILQEDAPVLEKSSIDEFYIDITGLDKFFGCYQWTQELIQKVRREAGLPLSFGLSVNKTVSKVATGEGKPQGHRKVDAGTEKLFLAPLDIRKIPMVGPKTGKLLQQMGVRTVKTMQEMPCELMENVLGKSGSVIWHKAQGIDPSPVVPYSERKSISMERTFDKDTIDMEKLRTLLTSFTAQLAFQLRQETKLTACVTAKIRYSNFDTHTLQSRIAYTSADHILIPKVLELFEKLYSRRMLIRLIGIKFSHLVHGNYQIDLFNDTQKMISLHQAMDKVNMKYDDFLIERASGFTTEQAAKRREHRKVLLNRIFAERELKGKHKRITSAFYG